MIGDSALSPTPQDPSARVKALAAQANAVADQYRAQLPAGFHPRYSGIANADIVAILLKGFRLGLKQDDCCRAAGISTRTLQRWQALAEAHPDSAFGAFVAALKSARAAGKIELLERIKQAGNKDHLWTANAWLLERTDPEQFALREDTESGPAVIVRVGCRDVDVKLGPPNAVNGAVVEESRAILASPRMP